MPSDLQIHRLEAVREGAKIVVTIEIRNLSSGNTWYLWSGLRGFSYTAETKTLYLDLASAGGREVPPGIQVVSRHPPKIPKQVPCPPGQIVVLLLQVPNRTRTTSVAGQRLTVKEESIGPITRVICDLGYNEQPASLTASPAAIRALLTEQTHVVHTEATVNIP